ncbi:MULTISPECIES: glycosyl hydrolase family 18 protein [Waltera]|jgi:spore germination protein YaaH|uniref:SH3 domain-containing protein n=1 Tax=Waltera acetigignens TaxID=2981769 RepID=A0AAE3D7L7_9FIRM|nr:glycosyl hydrolase family 18 protein [Brotolimicola acetigignens]MCC2118875.1 SH3 domain-containing protein [Brotolimicola acetigignens]
MKKRILPVIIAILLILVIAGGALGKVLLDKYSYSKEEADWNEFYQVSESDRSAIILQDEMVEEQALIRDDVCYFDLATVHKYMNEVFYADMTEKLLLYANPTEVIRTTFGETSYTTTEGTQDAGYVISFVEGDTVYVAADYVKLFTNYSYDCYDRHVQVYTEWGTRQVAQLKKDTAVRLRGGVKSPILTQAAKGDTLEILEQMETWSKVKTSDSVIGYVENKRLGDITEETETPVTDYQEPEYTALTSDSKICLGWHSIGGVGGNDTLYSMVSGTKGMNVIAPTWFSLTDENGSIRNFGTANYVTTAHNMGLQVWGVVDNFNYANETGTAISTLNMLSSTTSRQNFVRNVTDAAVSLGLDGINVDFEQLSSDCGPHYVEFIRELSIQCRNMGLVLSIANYVPFNFNDYYRLDIQGQVADYVIIMGYDEHWHGSKDPGSVASISYVSGGLDRTLQEVPANKVVNALPFYTILWKTEGTDVTDEYITMNNEADFMSRAGVTAEWDEETCQNYAEWTSGNATYQIWLEDAESIAVKLNMMATKNIGGVAVWRLGYGTQAAWELINAYLQ